jgi:protein-S-isoprenylcysteine O-methyltransferase Ste14
MRALENKIPPPIVFALIGGAMWIIAGYGPALPVAPALSLSAAIVCAITGLTVVLLGVLAFRKARTTVNPVQIENATALVSDGIYRYTRNPMYLGLTTLLTGWAIYLGTIWVFLGPVLLALFIVRFQVIPEERVMKAKFGQAYADYCLRVRRWI